jgi:hypothetical protein
MPELHKPLVVSDRRCATRDIHIVDALNAIATRHPWPWRHRTVPVGPTDSSRLMSAAVAPLQIPLRKSRPARPSPQRAFPNHTLPAALNLVRPHLSLPALDEANTTLHLHLHLDLELGTWNLELGVSSTPLKHHVQPNQ